MKIGQLEKKSWMNIILQVQGKDCQGAYHSSQLWASQVRKVKALPKAPSHPPNIVYIKDEKQDEQEASKTRTKLNALVHRKGPAKRKWAMRAIPCKWCANSDLLKYICRKLINQRSRQVRSMLEMFKHLQMGENKHPKLKTRDPAVRLRGVSDA